jgi:hypothetical protein
MSTEAEATMAHGRHLTRRFLRELKMRLRRAASVALVKHTRRASRKFGMEKMLLEPSFLHEDQDYA